MSTRPYKDSQCFAGAWLRQGLLTTMVAMGCWFGGGKTGQCKEIRLVEDGKPLAAIVVASNASHAAAFAAQELRDHIEKITGAKLAIMTDDKEIKGAQILVGESAATRKLGLKSEDFKDQEYLIRFLPDTLVLMGRDSSNPYDAIIVRGQVKSCEGKYGKALEFNEGVVRVNDCGFSDEEGTMEAWVWLPAKVPEKKAGTILRIDSIDNSYHIVQREPSTGRIRYFIYSGRPGGEKSALVESGELKEGWHHIVATHSLARQKIELFVDGVSQGTGTYYKTSCNGEVLQIGGLQRERPYIPNPFIGKIDEVHITRNVRRPGADQPAAPCKADDNTMVLMHCDEDGVPVNLGNGRKFVGPPDQFDGQGTCYAVYDFLERYCGVRWYGPGEAGLVYPRMQTLKVNGAEIRRSPAFAVRTVSISIPPHRGWDLWDQPSPEAMKRYLCRLRVGGLKYACNHSFYGYYDRFWKKNPDCPHEALVFEAEHPEYFAVGGRDWRDKQLCYSNSNTISQIVRDARDYFDGKGLKSRAQAAGDYFALVPMDHGSYCKCPACQSQFNLAEKNNPYEYHSGYASDYIFGCANKVAREIKISHPGKYISTLAYYNYALPPARVNLETNISVMMCLNVRGEWDLGCKSNDLKMYQSWVDEGKGRRPLYVWLYYNFPEGVAIPQKFNCFPGFFAHTAAEQIKMFARDGIRGAFIEEDHSADLIDLYAAFKLMDDPTIDIDRMLDEFFEGYFGAAAEPMKRMYSRIEAIYSDPNNYPAEVREEPKHRHQTEEMAWGYLGTAERMRELGKLMEEAGSKATTEMEKKRVGLFKKVIWDYMVAGRNKYLAKNKQKAGLTPVQLDQERAKERASLDTLKKKALPMINVPHSVVKFGGDPRKADWTKAVNLEGWRHVTGEPTSRKISGKLAHDGEYLYLKLEEQGLARALINKDEIWNGDDWEIFFARERGKRPYYQIGINPSGKSKALQYGEKSNEWESGAKIISEKEDGKNWTVFISFPLAKVLPNGIKPGEHFYANFYRTAREPEEYLAWSPNFEKNFHILDRLGELTLE